MNVTISLDEAQTAQLQRQADARRLAPEQLARDLLGAALGSLAEQERWDACNRRRVELIRKGRTAGLTADEAKELDQLQAAVDQRLEPTDRRLLAEAEQLRRLAEGLADEPIP